MRSSITETSLHSLRTNSSLVYEVSELHLWYVSQSFEQRMRRSVGKVVGGDGVFFIEAFLAYINLIVEGFEAASDAEMPQKTELIRTRVTSGVRCTIMAIMFQSQNKEKRP